MAIVLHINLLTGMPISRVLKAHMSETGTLTEFGIVLPPGS